MGDRAICMTSSEKSDTEIICLVDDDLSILKSIERLLASDGFSVCAFNKPKEFLTYVRAHAVPLVVLDIWMEEMSGLELQAQLSELSPNTRVIIMTGREGATSRSTTADMGASAFFTKPFDDEQFLCAVHSALEERPRNV